MLIKCPECGGNVSDKATACPHCGNPIIMRSSEGCHCEKRNGIKALTVASQKSLNKVASDIKSKCKRFRYRRFCRAPLTVTIPAALMMILSLVLFVSFVMYAEDSFQDGNIGLWIGVSCFACVPLAIGRGLIRGNLRIRTLVSVGMIVWLLFAAINNICSLIIVLPIVVLWFFSLFSTSASHWFAAHKRLERKRKMKKQQLRKN